MDSLTDVAVVLSPQERSGELLQATVFDSGYKQKPQHVSAGEYERRPPFAIIVSGCLDKMLMQEACGYLSCFPLCEAGACCRVLDAGAAYAWLRRQKES